MVMKIKANQIFQTVANNRRSISTKQKYSLLGYNKPKFSRRKALFDLDQKLIYFNEAPLAEYQG